MIKKLLIATAITLLPLSATALTNEQCYQLADVYELSAQARDDGAAPQSVFLAMVQGGIPTELAQIITRTVFNLDDKDPTEIVALVLNECIGQES